jgi:hypothetical protein
MEEKPPSFTVTDRRKFTVEGDLREQAATAAPEETAEERVAERPVESSARIITMPAPKQEEPEPKTVEEPVSAEDPITGPSLKEAAEQHAAYEQSAREIDDLLRQANPDVEAAQDTSFEHVIQSIYLSAVMAMGAGTEPGQKPRIDIVGARQSIDMLAILQDKTKGNLTEKEQRLLQNALFDLRMMFVELTNAIAQSAQQPPPVKK